MRQRRALITGVTGQDGAYLARLLLDQGYAVVGFGRPCSKGEPAPALDWIGAQAVERIDVDLLDADGLRAVMRAHRPDEVYNLAAVSDLKSSWERPVDTAQLNGMAVINLLEALRLEAPAARFFQASSAEMLASGSQPADITGMAAPLRPSPYASAKLFAHAMVGNYRRGYGLFACSGVLFNHESPLRSQTFVTRKVTQAAARISLGLASEVLVSNLDARRDWGHAADVVGAMWLMLQHDRPDDYVVATGENHSVGDVANIAFAHLGLDARDYLRIDPAFVGAVETERPSGDASKARRVLGWRPTIPFDAMICEMVDADIERLRARSADLALP